MCIPNEPADWPGKNVSFLLNLGVSLSPQDACISVTGACLPAVWHRALGLLAPQRNLLLAFSGQLFMAGCAQLSTLWSDMILLALLL